MEGMELVKDRNLEEINTMVEPMVGGTRVELWLKDCVNPRSQSMLEKPG